MLFHGNMTVNLLNKSKKNDQNWGVEVVEEKNARKARVYRVSDGRLYVTEGLLHDEELKRFNELMKDFDTGKSTERYVDNHGVEHIQRTAFKSACGMSVTVSGLRKQKQCKRCFG